MPGKKSTTKRRRRRSLTVKPTSRRRSRRKKGMLGDMFTPAVARGAARSVINGAVGGGIASVLERLLAGRLNPLGRVAAPFVLGFAAAAIFKQPEVAAGITAVGANQLMKEAGLAEDNMYLQDNNYASKVKQLPAALDSYGNPLGEDEMYLQEGEEMYLQQGYEVGYAPDFASPTVPVTVDDIQ